MQTLDIFSQEMLPRVEAAMQRSLASVDSPETTSLHEMMAYHMGWAGDGAGTQAQGKRIRPLLVLLSYGASCSRRPDWAQAIPAAAAVELVHNFSLIHDDIQDDSPLRRGRATVWKKWGIAHAINAGDSMYSLAYQALMGLASVTSAEIALDAQDVLQKTCVALTQGQYLDMSFENRQSVTRKEYWAMIGGKTAALLAACTELGALAAGAPPDKRTAYREFGRSLGLAFQVRDDILGIWGDEGKTGKSAASDLVAGKKSLPVIFGLEKNGAFAEQWQAGPVQTEQAPALAAQLAIEGAREFAEAQADAQTHSALQFLENADPQGDAGRMLIDLADYLLKRHV